MYLTLLAPKSFVFVNMCMMHTAMCYYNETDLWKPNCIYALAVK